MAPFRDMPLYVDEYDPLLNGYRECLDGWILFLFTFDLLHGYIIGAHLDLVRIEHGLPCDDVELPAVPRAFDNFALAAVLDFKWFVSECGAGDLPSAERGALVRAGAPECVILSMNVENPYGRAIYIKELA